MHRVNSLWNTGILILVTTQTISALCAMPVYPYSIVKETVINNQDAVIVSAGRSIIYSTESGGPLTTDTLYSFDLLSSLVDKFNASDIVVIAATRKAIQFVPEFTESNQTVFASESVTVCIEAVFKGDIQPVWNFINAYPYPSYSLSVDPVTGDSARSIMMLSHGTPGYGSIINERFLLFLKREEIPVEGQVFNMPIAGACDHFTFAYKISGQNEIYFDGFTNDPVAGKVVAVPELKIPVDNLFSAIGIKPVPVVAQKRTIPGNSFETAAAARYDLLGKKIRNDQQAASSKRAAGLHIHTGKTKDNVLISITSVVY